MITRKEQYPTSLSKSLAIKLNYVQRKIDMALRGVTESLVPINQYIYTSFGDILHDGLKYIEDIGYHAVRCTNGEWAVWANDYELKYYDPTDDGVITDNEYMPEAEIRFIKSNQNLLDRIQSDINTIKEIEQVGGGNFRISTLSHLKEFALSEIILQLKSQGYAVCRCTDGKFAIWPSADQYVIYRR